MLQEMTVMYAVASTSCKDRSMPETNVSIYDSYVVAIDISFSGPV